MLGLLNLATLSPWVRSAGARSAVAAEDVENGVILLQGLRIASMTKDAEQR